MQPTAVADDIRRTDFDLGDPGCELDFGRRVHLLLTYLERPVLAVHRYATHESIVAYSKL